MVQLVVRALRRAGAKADASCGIHIHVGLGEHTPQSLRRLVNIVNAKEDLLTQALGISPERRGRWCQPVEPVFLTELKPPQARHHGGAGTALVPCQRRVQRAGLAAARRFPLRHQPLPPPESARGFSTERPAHTIEFRAFNGTLHAGEIKAYIQLCLAISHQALASKSASPTRPITVNPKYTFRCWLLRLGFIGEEFEVAREHLTKRLPGNAAWRQAESAPRAS